MQRGRGEREMISSIIPDHLNIVAQHIHLSLCLRIDTHCKSLCLYSVCVCVRVCVSSHSDAAVMVLATCQILHSSISIVRSGDRLLLISHSFYSKALEHIQLEARVDQDVQEYAKSAQDIS